METAVGVFDSRDKAEEALKELLKRNVPQDAIVFLTRSETEAQSLAKEFGAWAGGFAGGAAGMTAGVVAATLFVIPGLGQALALGIGATALLGLAGAGVGSAAGKSAAESKELQRALPDNEDAALFRSLLKEGRSLIIVRTPWHEVASVACSVLDRTGIGIKERQASTRMQSVTRPQGDVQVVEISGRITLGEGNVMLRDVVQTLIEKGHKQIVLNLEKVDHVDSAGIGELVRSHTTARKAGGHLKLAAPNSRVTEMLKMTSLHSVFDVYGDEAAAVQSFAKSAGAKA